MYLLRNLEIPFAPQKNKTTQRNKTIWPLRGSQLTFGSRRFRFQFGEKLTQKKSARVSPTAPEPQFAGAFHPPHGRPKGKRIDPIAVAAGRKTRPMSMIIATHQLEPETSWQFLLKHFWGRETELSYQGKPLKGCTRLWPITRSVILVLPGFNAYHWVCFKALARLAGNQGLTLVTVRSGPTCLPDMVTSCHNQGMTLDRQMRLALSIINQQAGPF